MYDDDKLVTALHRLRVSTDKQNSYWRNFLRGLFAAVGGALGLAALVLIAFFFLSRVPESSATGKFFHAIANIVERNQR